MARFIRPARLGVGWPPEAGGFFRGITPFAGTPPKGYLVDFLGTLTDARFRRPFGAIPELAGGVPVKTRLPSIEDGEGWFEAVSWFEAARAAHDSYTMITLGACYGAQAVGAARALMAVNPMPFRLVAVEPEPENMAWLVKHFRDNGIEPADHWLIRAAVSDSNEPVLFPVGAPGSGAQNCVATNEAAARKAFFDEILRDGRAAEALGDILLRNTTGLKRSLVPGHDFIGEIRLVSAVTPSDILAPLGMVDLLEADMQQSEIVVFPAAMGLLQRKVRRVHIGTHGAEVHAKLARLFRRDGWDVVFDFSPNGAFSLHGSRFTTNDGVLAAVNPRLA